MNAITRKINMSKINCDWCLPGTPGTHKIIERFGSCTIAHFACGHHLRVFYPSEVLPAPRSGAVSMIKALPTVTEIEYWVPVGGNALQMVTPSEVTDLVNQGIRPDVRIMRRPEWAASRPRR